MSKKKINGEFDNIVDNINEMPEKSNVPSGSGKFRVSLPGLPPMDIEAVDISEAKILYNRFTGVLNTSAKYEIENID